MLVHRTDGAEFNLFFMVTLHYLDWCSTALTDLTVSDLVREFALDQLPIFKHMDKTLYAGDTQPMCCMPFPCIQQLHGWICSFILHIGREFKPDILLFMWHYATAISSVAMTTAFQVYCGSTSSPCG